MRSMRLLVAGDKSHAGKSTVSLGLLIALLEAGFLPSELAYIKPATQCVSSTLAARFCEDVGIACEHIGPVVFHKGYTRRVLDERAAPPRAESDASPPPRDDLTSRCAEAVDRISRGKRLTVIDGVGYPSVGSIVGCSSADIAVACRAPVLLVGKPGVGDAVDSFNLCASYFEARRVPVLGAIFNKLPVAGYYGLEQCDEYIRKYMRTARPRQRVYGLLPSSEELAGLAGEEACGFAYQPPEARPSAGPLSEADRAFIAHLSKLFREHVDTASLTSDLERALEHPEQWSREETLYA